MKRRTFISGTVATAAATLAAPAVVRAQETFNWRLITSWPPEFPAFQVGPGSATDLAERITSMSNGRLKVKVYAAGELAPWNEVFDAVSAGTVEMGHTAPYYWSGKKAAFAYFCTVPFGLNFQGYCSWMYHGGGKKLWDEAYAPFNLISFPCLNTGVQMTGWFRKPIKSVADLKGLKIRISGLAGVILKSIGATQIALPASEIFASLERGVIDAAEWVGPYQDRRMGFHKIAKNYYSTGWHETAAAIELMVNTKAWGKLSKDLQAIVQNACQACHLDGLTWTDAVNIDALEDMVKNHGVKVQPLPGAVIAQLKKVGQDVLAAEAEKDPLTKKVHEHYFGFKKKWSLWASLTEQAYHNSIR